VKGTGADFDVVWLEQRATLFVPKTLETQDDFLKRRHRLASWMRKKLILLRFQCDKNPLRRACCLPFAFSY
jgi:hypothetical protein